MKFLNFSVFLFIFAAFLFFLPSKTNAQRRDYMTDEEIEIVRDSQEIDLRIDVLTKMIDRRFAVLNNEPSPIKKNSELWGAPPKGTRIELLSDINKLLTKAIDDIDMVAERKAFDAKMFPKAVKHLDASCTVYVPKLRMEYDKAADEKEKGVILGAIESCGQVKEAVGNLEQVVPKEEKKGDKKKKDN